MAPRMTAAHKCTRRDRRRRLTCLPINISQGCSCALRVQKRDVFFWGLIHLAMFQMLAAGSDPTTRPRCYQVPAMTILQFSKHNLASKPWFRIPAIKHFVIVVLASICFKLEREANCVRFRSTAINSPHFNTHVGAERLCCPTKPVSVFRIQDSTSLPARVARRDCSTTNHHRCEKLLSGLCDCQAAGCPN